MSIAPRAFERLAAADQDAVLGGLAGADHDRRRRGQAERARAGDDQHRDGRLQRERHARLGPEDQPADERQRRQDQDGRHEHFGDAVGQALHRRLGALRLLDQADDLRERRVAADLGRAKTKQPVLLSVAPMTCVARTLLDRQALAGEHALVERRAALLDRRRRPGTFSPGRTRTRSPTWTASIGMSCSTPSRITRAVLACRPISALIAAPVCFLARASSQRPSRISAMMITAVS